MWYFTWILGVGFAVLLGVMNAMWGENEEARGNAGEHPVNSGGVGSPAVNAADQK